MWYFAADVRIEQSVFHFQRFTVQRNVQTDAVRIVIRLHIITRIIYANNNWLVVSRGWKNKLDSFFTDNKRFK